MAKSIDGPPVTSNSRMKKSKRVSSLALSTEKGYLLLYIGESLRFGSYMLLAEGMFAAIVPGRVLQQCPWKHVHDFMLA